MYNEYLNLLLDDLEDRRPLLDEYHDLEYSEAVQLSMKLFEAEDPFYKPEVLLENPIFDVEYLYDKLSPAAEGKPVDADAVVDLLIKMVLEYYRYDISNTIEDRKTARETVDKSLRGFYSSNE